jgi:hypothetical protein
MEKIIIEDLKEKNCYVDEKFSHLTYKKYSKLSKEEKNEIPPLVIKQIQIRENVTKILKYHNRFKYSKHISIALFIATILSLVKLPILYTLIFTILCVLSTIFCVRQYHVLDAYAFAYSAMEKFYEKLNL